MCAPAELRKRMHTCPHATTQARHACRRQGRRACTVYALFKSIHAQQLTNDNCGSVPPAECGGGMYATHLRKQGAMNSNEALKRPLSCSILNPAGVGGVSGRMSVPFSLLRAPCTLWWVKLAWQGSDTCTWQPQGFRVQGLQTQLG